jgi:hypothetical protein
MHDEERPEYPRSILTFRNENPSSLSSSSFTKVYSTPFSSIFCTIVIHAKEFGVGESVVTEGEVIFVS